jgi:hypothetical protein
LVGKLEYLKMNKMEMKSQVQDSWGSLLKYCPLVDALSSNWFCFQFN